MGERRGRKWRETGQDFVHQHFSLLERAFGRWEMEPESKSDQFRRGQRWAHSANWPNSNFRFFHLHHRRNVSFKLMNKCNYSTILPCRVNYRQLFTYNWIFNWLTSSHFPAHLPTFPVRLFPRAFPAPSGSSPTPTRYRRACPESSKLWRKAIICQICQEAILNPRIANRDTKWQSSFPTETERTTWGLCSWTCIHSFKNNRWDVTHQSKGDPKE